MISLALASFDRSWMWDELWRWQADHRGGAEVVRPLEPDHALFVVSRPEPGARPPLVAGLGLHTTRSYIFLDDLTTNPDEPPRVRHQAVGLLLQAAQQYAVSVAKPICAFTSVSSLYKIARRLGFAARPAGALLVFATAALPLGPQKNRAAQGDKSRAARLTVDGEKRPAEVRQGKRSKVPGQVGKRLTDRRDNGARTR